MRSLTSEGVLQVATGERHRDEAINSVERIRPYLNGRPISLVTDKPEQVPPGIFDRVVKHRDPQKATEIRFYRFYIFPIKEHCFSTQISLSFPQLMIFSIY